MKYLVCIDDTDMPGTKETGLWVLLKNEELEKTGIEYRTITKQEAKQY